MASWWVENVKVNPIPSQVFIRARRARSIVSTGGYLIRREGTPRHVWPLFKALVNFFLPVTLFSPFYVQVLSPPSIRRIRVRDGACWRLFSKGAGWEKGVAFSSLCEIDRHFWLI